MNISRGFKYDIATDTLSVRPNELQQFLNEIEIRLNALERDQSSKTCHACGDQMTLNNMANGKKLWLCLKGHYWAGRDSR